jgi:hypothetical protein
VGAVASTSAKHRNIQGSIQGWVAGAAAGFADAETVEALRVAPTAMQPSTAWFPLIEGFRWAAATYPILAGLANAPEPPVRSPDWAMQQIVVADYDRVRGLRDQAVNRLDYTWEKSRQDRMRPPLWTSLKRAMERLGIHRDWPMPDEKEDKPLHDLAILLHATGSSKWFPGQIVEIASRYPRTLFEARALELLGKEEQAAEVYQQPGLRPSADALLAPKKSQAPALKPVGQRPRDPGPAAEDARMWPMMIVELVARGGAMRAVCRVDGDLFGDTLLPASIYSPVVDGRFEDLARTLTFAGPDYDMEERFTTWLQREQRQGDVSLQIPPGRAPAWPWERWLNARTRNAGLRCMFRTLPPGASSNTVRWIQRAANELIYAGLNVDGMLGANTLNAIQTLQETFSLVPTGQITPELENRIVREMRTCTRIKVKGGDPATRRTTSIRPWLQLYRD